MPEVSKKVQPVEVRFFCDRCPDVEMKFTGNVQTSIPPQYVHKCSACGKTTGLRSCYPTIRYEPVDD